MNSASDASPDSEGTKERIRAIRSAHPGNLMARYFDEDYFDSLDESKRDRAWRIIRSGIENPDSRMGAYAQNSSDYEDFGPLLEPMIRDYHEIPPGLEIAQEHDWSATASRCARLAMKQWSPFSVTCGLGVPANVRTQKQASTPWLTPCAAWPF